ncbi:MAG: helix-turn-helix domain-containing protein [Ignavibacteriaceae bacterium]|jgi:excisionase family DNA binding protein|nr:helix-turn-helix domain-containing protein [Ignavibacteriaceae bacterium]
MKEFFSVLEVAKMLQLSRSAVLYNIKTGKLKAMQVGKVYIISQEYLGEFLKEHKAKRKSKKVNQTSLNF